MKPGPVVIALSAAANAVLIGVLFARPAFVAPVLREAVAGGAHNLAAAHVGKADPSSDGQLWSALVSADDSKLVAQLRAAGFPPAMIRAVLAAQVEERFRPRYDAWLNPLIDTPYWQPDPFQTGSLPNRKLANDSIQLYREQGTALRKLLGELGLSAEPTAGQRRQFGELSPATRDRLQRINDDYNEMSGRLQTTMQDITLPEDREKLDLIERERRADIAAALSPAERAEYEMRSSPTVERLREPLTWMDATEAEFRAIYALQSAADERLNAFGPGGLPSDQAMLEGRSPIHLQLERDLRAALGDARYADYARATDRDFLLLTRSAQGQGFSLEPAQQIFALRATVERESNRIVDDPTIATEQKRAALQTLAQSMRAQVQSLVGAAAGPAYLQVVNRWLAPVERGNGVAFAANGLIKTRAIGAPPND